LTSLLHHLFHIWAVDLVISFLNFTFLTSVLQPVYGELVAHQIGMSIRIIYIFLLAYSLLRGLDDYNHKDLATLGAMWMGLWLLFEWGGSLLIGRPVTEILVGWNIFAGYMWPYVLLAYLASPLVVGAILHPTKRGTINKEGSL
jgi:hypothetical protein